MKALFPLVVLIILALTAVACATAAPVATPLPGTDPSNCARFPDEADRQREHDAIQWQQCPVIENGTLRAAGTTTGRVHGGGRNFPTFVIQYRNTDEPFYVIRRPIPAGYTPPTYTGYILTESGEVVIGKVNPSGYAGIPTYKGSSRGGAATHWEVRPQFFSIEAWVGTPDEPVDLWVWGSDAPQAYANSYQKRRQRGLRGLALPPSTGDFNAKPLAIRSIGYIETDATPDLLATYPPLPTFTRIPTATPLPTATPTLPILTPTINKPATCPDTASLYRSLEIVDWEECPVIENGVLRASGTVKNGYTLVYSDFLATFTVKARNSDQDIAVIISPSHPSVRSGPNNPFFRPQDNQIVATHFLVTLRKFEVEAPVGAIIGNTNPPVDLLVWGQATDDLRPVPLAIHSVLYIE